MVAEKLKFVMRQFSRVTVSGSDVVDQTAKVANNGCEG